MRNGKRDYKRELAWEKASGNTRVKDRAARNKARSIMEKEGLVKKGDGKQVDHKKALTNGGKNTRANLRAVSDKTNLSKEARRKKAAARR